MHSARPRHARVTFGKKRERNRRNDSRMFAVMETDGSCQMVDTNSLGSGTDFHANSCAMPFLDSHIPILRLIPLGDFLHFFGFLSFFKTSECFSQWPWSYICNPSRSFFANTMENACKCEEISHGLHGQDLGAFPGVSLPWSKQGRETIKEKRTQSNTSQCWQRKVLTRCLSAFRDDISRSVIPTCR